MKNAILAVLLLAFMLALPSHALANTGAAYLWKNHAAPYTFLFGNHIDMHQQSQLVDGGQIQGFLYIHYTGETINGVPVAEHSDCSADPAACVVGWTFLGVRATATAVSIDSMGMAQFCAKPTTLRQLVGFTHFHWLGDPMMDMDIQMNTLYSGYLMKLTARSTFYFDHHGMMVLVTPGIDTVSHANVTPCP